VGYLGRKQRLAGYRRSMPGLTPDEIALLLAIAFLVVVIAAAISLRR